MNPNNPVDQKSSDSLNHNPVLNSSGPSPLPSNLSVSGEFENNPPTPMQSDFNQAAPNEPFRVDAVHTLSANDEIPDKPKKSGKKTIIIALAILFFILLASAAVLVYALAYEKIELSGNRDLQNKIAYFVMSLPLTPKTPKFLLAKSVIEHEKISSNTFDVSLAIKSSQNESLLPGLNQFSFVVKGVTDYSNPKEIDTSFNLAFGEYLNMDVIKYGKTYYFKVNKLPDSMLYLIGINAERVKPLFTDWIAYTRAEIETEAGKYLEEKDEKNTSYDSILDSADELADEEILKHIVVENSVEDGHKIYRVKLAADDELINALYEKALAQNQKTSDLYFENEMTDNPKPSEIVKNFEAELQIDRSSYLIHKFILSFDLKPDSNLSSLKDSNVLGEQSSSLGFLDSTLSFAVVGIFDNFGEPPNISPPTVSITFDEFTKKYYEAFPELFAPLARDLSFPDDSFSIPPTLITPSPGPSTPTLFPF